MTFGLLQRRKARDEVAPQLYVCVYSTVLETQGQLEARLETLK